MRLAGRRLTISPTDYRLVDPVEADKKTENGHFREMLVAVKAGMGKGYLAADPEFAAIRNTPEFKKLAKGE